MILALFYVIHGNKSLVYVYAKEQVVADQLKDISSAFMPVKYKMKILIEQGSDFPC